MKKLYYKVCGPGISPPVYATRRDRADRHLRERAERRGQNTVAKIWLYECRTDPDISHADALLAALNGEIEKIFIRERKLREA